MALLDLGQHAGVSWPNYGPTAINVAYTLTNTSALNTTTRVRLAVTVPVTKTGTITDVLLKFGTVTTGAPGFELRLETVNPANGQPTGTLWGTDTKASRAVTSGDAGTAVLHTLDAGAAVVAGDFLALVLVSDGVGVFQVQRAAGPFGPITSTDLPLIYAYNGSSYSNDFTSGVPLIGALRYSGAYEFVPWFLCTPGTGSLAATSTVEVGAKVTFPYGGKLRAISFPFPGNPAATDVLNVYDSNDNLITSYTFNGVYIQSNVTKLEYLPVGDITITAESVYRFVLKRASGSLSVPFFTVPSTDYLPATPYGTRLCLTTRTSGGAWTDTNTSVPPLQFNFSQIEQPSSGGGGSRGILTGGRL